MKPEGPTRHEPAFLTIHTLEARGNVLLEVLRDWYHVGDSAMRRLIWREATALTSLLERRGVRYSQLRPALVPQVTKRELALFFDRASIESGAYGWHVHANLIPLLTPDSSHSVLHGDLTAEAMDPEWIRAALEIHLKPSGNPFSLVDANQIYCVYLNNVSKHLLQTLHDRLKGYGPYIGYADTTYASQFKEYLSHTLVPAYVKWGRTVLQADPDADAPSSNENLLGYPFEASGLTCRTVPDLYYGVFLSYKIERPVLAGDEADTSISTNVLADTVDLGSCTVEIDKEKFEHLKAAHGGSLRRLGVLGAPKATLERLIQAKMASNYIYSLSYSEELGVAKFNIVLELGPLDGGEPVRTLASLELIAAARRIRLITFF